jgi:porphobilinogen synthase
MLKRPRRLRVNGATRHLVAETELQPRHLVLPLFLMDGNKKREAIASMPGVDRLSIDLAIEEAHRAFALGIQALALFPKIPDEKKDPKATESSRSDNLMLRAIREFKNQCPDLLLFTDVAMDPYSSDGHDGWVRDGVVLNDESLPILAAMAVAQAEAGADFVAPSDMMDGRVEFIRRALDERGYEKVGILSYTAKYASCFYGPFRDALDSAPRAGDKKTYQMDYKNRREALRELRLDSEEGADIVMVKPALSYLDIISDMRRESDIPVAAYLVSGEYSMMVAASERGWLDLDRAFLESHTALRRAGADLIFSYAAKRVAELLKNTCV